MDNKCEICGERIDWNNPNIHYGGHTCDTERLDKIGATERYVGSLKQPYKSIRQTETNTVPPNNSSNSMFSDFLIKQNKELKYLLSMCDPRIDYGNGLVCQFCGAGAGEQHKSNCIYKHLTDF